MLRDTPCLVWTESATVPADMVKTCLPRKSQTVREQHQSESVSVQSVLLCVRPQTAAMMTSLTIEFLGIHVCATLNEVYLLYTGNTPDSLS